MVICTTEYIYNCERGIKSVQQDNKMMQEIRDDFLNSEEDNKNTREVLQKEADRNVEKCYAEQLTKLKGHHQQLKKQIQDKFLLKEKALVVQLESFKMNLIM